MRQAISYRYQTSTATYIVWFIALAFCVPIIAYAGFAKAVSPLLKLPTKENFHPTQTVFYDRNGTELYRTAGAHQPIPKTLNEVPRPLVLATLAAEDSDFYKHRGIDPEGLARATYKNIFTNDQQGGSTITQQLIKNTYLTSDKTITRKLREMTYAVLIEQKFSKDQILERYLNEVYYGQQSYGVADAAKTYFGKDLSQLSLAESTMLAGLPSAPTLYSPLGENPQRAKQRQKYVLERMVKLNYITQADADVAFAEPLNYVKAEEVLYAPHFVFYVKQQLAKFYGDDTVDSGGLKVYTTLDLNTQKTMEQEVANGVAGVARYRATNGAAVAMNPKNGEVLGMVGSADFANDAIGGKVNVATAERQPGSSFKPLVYLNAFKQGYPAAYVLPDRPKTFGGSFTPKNYDGAYHGNVTTRTALGSSLNIPAVEMLDKVGVQNAIDFAHQIGISTLNDPDRYGLSLVLGGGEVKLLDLTSAYGVMANQGTSMGTASVTKVVDGSGKTLYERKPQGKSVVDPGAAYMITDILSDNRARVIGFGANSPLNFPRPAAVKTGTTNDYKDNWTLGYTPSLVVGVWVGNNDGTPMQGISGVQGAAPIWNSIMQKLLAGTPIERFDQPKNVYRWRGDWAVKGITDTSLSSYNNARVPTTNNSDGGDETAPPDSFEDSGSAPPARQGDKFLYWSIDADGKKRYYYQ